MAEYYSDDITWCSNRRCKNTKCERNPKKLKPTPFKGYSFADLEGSDYCKSGADMRGNNDQKL
jgi:hypothetical protein